MHPYVACAPTTITWYLTLNNYRMDCNNKIVEVACNVPMTYLSLRRLEYLQVT